MVKVQTDYHIVKGVVCAVSDEPDATYEGRAILKVFR
jgi:hypothetical protein